MPSTKTFADHIDGDYHNMTEKINVPKGQSDDKYKTTKDMIIMAYQRNKVKI